MKAMSDSTGVRVDVAKGHVDVAIDAIDEVMRYGNDVEGHTALVAALCARQVLLIVMEATDGFEAELACALQAVGLPVAR
jgi:transposase